MISSFLNIFSGNQEFIRVEVPLSQDIYYVKGSEAWNIKTSYTLYKRDGYFMKEVAHSGGLNLFSSSADNKDFFSVTSTVGLYEVLDNAFQNVLYYFTPFTGELLLPENYKKFDD